MTKTFTSRYQHLNPAQKQAVDTIEGPVMVIAGPGTGKTELLSMRVANILQKTDVLPQNILCLTFTESGASAMRERLVGLMGQAAYHVAIHTFHSFGTEIINTYPDYFYQGAHFRPADELSSYEILTEIFEKLPHDNPLATRINDEYTQLREVQRVISELKRSSLTPDELLKLLDHNDAFIEYAEPLIQAAFASPIRSKKALPALEPLRDSLQKFQPSPLGLPGFTPLARLCSETFAAALDESLALGKTTPITVWRNNWCEKNERGELILKDRARARKLRAASHIYYEYLVAMQANTLYDFDDMILRVVHALEVFTELRLALQEQYQYILVDEFQDTNGSQARILYNLTNNDVSAGRPNILVVGDDDQAIYSFQGAELSNILTFRDRYKDPAIITLTHNYRSAPVILTAARDVITQGSERLETYLEGLDKTLAPQTDPAKSTVKLVELPTRSDEYAWIVTEIQRRLENGQKPKDIAILTRKHSEMTHLLPYLHHAGIAVNYERRDNILELPPIVALESLARIVTEIAHQQFDSANGRLPELLAHPAWRLEPLHLWRLGLEAHRSQRYWLELMLETNGALKDIAEWLIVTAHRSLEMPLEAALDVLLGTYEHQVPEEESAEPKLDNFSSIEQFSSPLRDFFFPHDALEKHPGNYVSYLEALRVLRRKLRDWQPDAPLRLKDFIDFIELHRKTNTPITSPRAAAEEGEGICLMTAHKSKGLEFETVFVVNATDTTWGAKATSRSKLITYPANLPISPAGESYDERLRLFFVALTRAKRELLVSYANEDLSGKPTLRASFLLTDTWRASTPTLTEIVHSPIEAAENRWYENVLAVSDSDLQTLLTPALEKYKLSATHLNNFLDVTNGGPRAFLLQNLLRFPQAMQPSAAFGSAIHKTLQRAHAHLSATGSRRPVEDIMHDFEIALGEQRLSNRDHEHYLQKGTDALQVFLAQRHENFSEYDHPERSFANQGIVINDARLTGVLDLITIDNDGKTVTVTDYKTGKPAQRWQGRTDFEKIKLHKYKQQLLFYKLLVENSRDFGGRYAVSRGVLEFVEPASDGSIVQLEIDYSEADIERFAALLGAVWRRIKALDFPDTTQFEQNYKGILAFEDYLLDN